MSNIIEVLNRNLAKAGGIPSLPKINNDTDYNLASDSYAFLKKHFDKAEEHRKAETKPLLEKKREIDSAFKKFTDPLEKTMTGIKKLMSAYAIAQREAQKLLEQEASKETAEDFVVVDDLSVNKSSGEFSTNSIKTITKYRFKNIALNDVIEIPQLKFKQFLEKNTLPEFIESYEEESITIRKNF